MNELIKNPKHRKELEASKLHHQRLSFHSDIVLRKENASRYYATLMYWIGLMLPADKRRRIEDLITFPLSTNELMKDIFIGLERVWYAKNYIEKHTFISDEYETDFSSYLKQIKIRHMWQVEGWSSLKTGIDSVVVVDLPALQLMPRPEPYFYFISPNEIIDMDVDERNDMKYIIFTHENNTGDVELLVYDSISMRKYQYKDRKKGNLIAETMHELGYVPARMFWSDKLQDGNYINKRSPITDSLGDLDWLLFFKTSKKYLDLHAAYPIYITYDVTQENESKDKPTYWDGQRKETDHKGKGFMGPGSFTTIPPPLVGQPDMMTNPIQVVGAEIEACKFSVDEVDRLSVDIYRSCVGSDGEMLTKEAVNEKQVEANFKSREEVLINLARNLSEIMTWTYSTLAQMRYGIFFINSTVDFGEDFYLETADQLIESYSDARSKGVNDLILDTMNEKILDVSFKHRSKERERANIYKYLDPLPGLSIPEATAMVSTQAVTIEELKIKANLLKYLRMFELEYGDMVDYMPNNFQKKIETINQKIKEYARQQEQPV